MNSLERCIHHVLRYHPSIRKPISRIYKRLLFPFGGKEFYPESSLVFNGCFFGFHDKSPWNYASDKVLSHKLRTTTQDDDRNNLVDVGYFDTNNNVFHKISETEAWNWQQGATLQWIGKSNTISFHKLADDGVKSIWIDLDSNNKVQIPHSTAAICPSGKLYASFCFDRFGIAAPGYGYPDLERLSTNKFQNTPAKLTLRNVSDHSTIMEVSTTDVKNRRQAYKKSVAYFSHTLFSPEGKYLAFFHRYATEKNVIYTDLYILNIKTQELRHIKVDDASHLTWLNSEELLAFCIPKRFSPNYYIINAARNNLRPLDSHSFSCDGHPNACERKAIFATDTYPDKYSFMHLYLYDLKKKEKREIAKIKSPVFLIDDLRCDLHPRISPKGDFISIDLPDKVYLRKHMIISI